VIPTARAILWNPNGRRNPGGRYPVFFEQKALTALHEHLLGVKGQALIGFLVGDLFECPTSRVRYAVVDSTIRLNQPIYGDKTQVVVSRLWERIQEELGRVGGHLIGWYHSHPPLAIDLAPGDVQTHEQYFTQPWHLALVIGADHERQPSARGAVSSRAERDVAQRVVVVLRAHRAGGAPGGGPQGVVPPVDELRDR